VVEEDVRISPRLLPAAETFEKSKDRDKVCEGILCPAAWEYSGEITCNLLGNEPMHRHGQNIPIETSVCVELHPLFLEHLQERFKPVDFRQSVDL
jgi:hypothetical protein